MEYRYRSFRVAEMMITLMPGIGIFDPVCVLASTVYLA